MQSRISPHFGRASVRAALLDALPGENCWQVALINSLNQYLCGEALIETVGLDCCSLRHQVSLNCASFEPVVPSMFEWEITILPAGKNISITIGRKYNDLRLFACEKIWS